MSGSPSNAELADARLSRALDVMAVLLRSLGEIDLLPPAQRAAALEAHALLVEHGG